LVTIAGNMLTIDRPHSSAFLVHAQLFHLIVKRWLCMTSVVTVDMLCFTNQLIDFGIFAKEPPLRRKLSDGPVSWRPGCDL